ncbi:cytochrome c nitrite reductase pentaheme subunit [bacterium BMS3Abin10]|nr:cytochrome c nitrite reductase pentaheme subunit [bacterium BMS3Abin10]GBE38237.1 cytochrome c nitrite reductase pentaheme subunit [bacterium BMS3Bbin08]
MSAEGGRSVLTVNYPPDRTVMELDLLSVSLGLPQGSADMIKVRVNDEERISIVPDSGFECFTVRLSPGVNAIDVTAFKKGREIDSVEFSVFRRSDLEAAYQKAPADFQKDYFHSKKRKECAECHVLVPTDADKKPVNPASFKAALQEGDKQAIASSSTCYSCHSKITSYPYVHGPASVWSCLSCHDAETEPMYMVKKPDAEVCFSCHVEQGRDWGAKKFIHGPVNTGKCAICHSPHASDNPFNLLKPTWFLCTSCHQKNASGRHIIAGYVYGDSHPTRGKPDPLRNGKELTCASCHNPHASDYPRLWALSAGSAFELCQMCHQK